MSDTLISFVRKAVDPVKYYETVFPDIHWGSGNEARVCCCFHEEKTPSMSVNSDTGKWYCHGCEIGGGSIVSFHAKKENLEKDEAARDLYHTFVRPIVPEKTVRKWHRQLLDSPDALRYVRSRRVSMDQIKGRKLGFDGNRFTFPVYNEFGLCVNVRKYNPRAKKGQPKMVNFKDGTDRSYGSPPTFYPATSFKLAREQGYVVVCEGEWDTTFLLSLGIPAVTGTGGAKSWPKGYDESFRGLRVIIAYDNDSAGEVAVSKKVVPRLAKVAIKVVRLHIPQLPHPRKGRKTKDVSEWADVDEEMRSKSGWLAAFDAAEELVNNPKAYVEQAETEMIALDQASLAKYAGKPIVVDALVTGKDTAPYVLPKKARVTCSRECDRCPLAEFGHPHKEVSVDPNDHEVLGMIDESEKAVQNRLISSAGVSTSKKCEAKCEVLESFNVEQVLLIPTLDSQAQYVQRFAYYVGHGLHSNRAYRFEGTTLPHPKDQHSTHLFHGAKPVQDEIENFEMTPELRNRLKAFQPGRTKLMAHLTRLAEWQSRNVTGIVDREDLHISVDLVYHSLNSFNFNGKPIHRGMLDVLIIGDTRCGKGFVAEGLKRYYSLGEVASGENCSFAGLIGGIDQVQNRRIVKWGLIPLNHGRMVVIDEASSIPESDFGKMSRVRSEGVAEITKIIRESTRANARLLWLSNTRDGRAIRERNYGVEAIKGLVGANEDIARFDFALSVATDEVDKDRINSEFDPNDTNDKSKYPPDLCRALVLWAWSRRPEQVRFTKEATTRILKQATELGNTFSPNIPLVQGENIRVKLAKIAAAIAARCFNADDTGEILIVDEGHVDCACTLLRRFYSKPSMGYDTYSKQWLQANKIESKGEIAGAINKYVTGEKMGKVIFALAGMTSITRTQLGDYIGDLIAADELVKDLVNLNCLKHHDGNKYFKTLEFNKWLREQQHKGDDL